MNDTAERLMDLAEARIRQGGYGSFSFREIAAELGISSASVHHHFPSKAAMTAAVLRRYADRFLVRVAAQTGKRADDPVRSYRDAIRAAHDQDGRMCTCGVISAEKQGLPDEVVAEMRSFFVRCVDDLARRLGGRHARKRAMHVMATLEGALILARAYGEIEVFDQATAALVGQ